MSIDQADEEVLIKMMVGRDVGERYPKDQSIEGKEILQIKDLTVNGKLHNLKLTLHQGEIVGVFGLMGAGRTEFARALFGIDHIDKGEIIVNGKRVNISSPRDAIEQGIGYLTEEDFRHIEAECQTISGMLSRLIQARYKSVSRKRQS